MTDHTQTVLDASRLRPSLREGLARGYRDLAEVNTLLGFPDIARHCADRAAALEYGGSISLAALVEEAL